MIVHAKALGFTTQRIGFKAKKATAAKKTPVGKKAVPVSAKPVAQKAAPTKKAVPTKKAAAIKTVAAKKAVSAKKTLPANKLRIAKAPAQPKASSNAAKAQFSRITKGLAKMGDKRPEKLKSFLRHLESMLGKDIQPSAVQEMVGDLELAGLIKVTGDKVSYIR